MIYTCSTVLSLGNFNMHVCCEILLVFQMQFKNSFFVKTIVDWNQLNESQVQAETITDFSSLISAAQTLNNMRAHPHHI